MERKEVTSVRLTAEARAILQWLAKNNGVSQGSIIELMLRARGTHEPFTVSESIPERRTTVSAQFGGIVTTPTCGDPVTVAD